MMNKGLLEIYGLSVCFVCVACLSIFTGIFLYTLVELALPQEPDDIPMFYPATMSSQGDMMATQMRVSPSFGQRHYAQSGTSQGAQETNSKPLSLTQQQALQQKRAAIIKADQQRARQRVQSRTIMSLVRSFIVLLIASLVFITHWQIAKKARNKTA